jgi:hypothetical protein
MCHNEKIKEITNFCKAIGVRSVLELLGMVGTLSNSPSDEEERVLFFDLYAKIINKVRWPDNIICISETHTLRHHYT